MLWEKGLLGDDSAQALLDTIVFCTGLYFALRSGQEHRQLRGDPCQIEVVEHPGKRAYLKYTEDTSKNHPRAKNNTESCFTPRQPRQPTALLCTAVQAVPR